MFLEGTVRCTFFRRTYTENAAGSVACCDAALGMLHARRIDVFGIILALFGAGALAEDEATCSAGEMNRGPCADH